MSGPDIRRALADHVETDAKDAATDVTKKASAFAEAALDLGELIALQELNKALAHGRAERRKEVTPPAGETAHGVEAKPNGTGSASRI